MGCAPTLGRNVCFTQFTNSHTDLFPNILRDTPRNDTLPAMWASLSPVKLTHKINHHRYLAHGLVREAEDEAGGNNKARQMSLQWSGGVW